MKRYRLIKDLPEFKIGDIFELTKDGYLWALDQSSDCRGWMLVYSRKTLDKFPNIMEEWFEEIKPAEPLIKDEKIRKAVRAWAEANEEEHVKVKGACMVTEFKGLHTMLGIELSCTWTRDGVYTIAELCGEEEE